MGTGVTIVAHTAKYASVIKQDAALHYDTLVQMSNAAAKATDDHEFNKLVADAYQDSAEKFRSLMQQSGMAIEYGNFLIDVISPIQHEEA